MREERRQNTEAKRKEAARGLQMRPPELQLARRHGQEKGWPLGEAERRERREKSRTKREEGGGKSEDRRQRREVRRVTRITRSRHHQTTTARGREQREEGRKNK